MANPNVYIKSVENLIKTAKSSPGRRALESYMDALRELKEGMKYAESIGRAAPSVYIMFAAEARKCAKALPEGPKSIKKQFEELATTYEYKARERSDK